MPNVLTPNAKQQFFDINAAMTPAERKRARTKQWLSQNREWRRAYDREYGKRHPEKHREKDRRQYAANAEKKRQKAREYARLRPEMRRKWLGYPEPTRPMSQTCECCGQSAGTKNFHLDHCHVTGRFRGWLCARCNLGIGYFKDSVAALQQAIEYLNRSRE